MLLMPHPPRRGPQRPSPRNCDGPQRSSPRSSPRTHPAPSLLKQSPRHRHSSTRRAQQHVSPRLPPIAAQLQAARPDLEAVQLSCCPDCFSVVQLVDLAAHRQGCYGFRRPDLKFRVENERRLIRRLACQQKKDKEHERLVRQVGVIQEAVRRHLGIKHAAVVLKAVLAVQCTWRIHNRKEKEKRLAKYFAKTARKLETKRKYMFRACVPGAVKGFAAAKAIQNGWRVHRIVKHLREGGGRRHFAPFAVAIQSLWRTSMVIKALAPMRRGRDNAAVRLQACFRRHQANTILARRHEAASVIQAAWRELENRKYERIWRTRSNLGDTGTL